MAAFNDMDLFCRKRYCIAVIAHRLEKSRRFYPVFYRNSSKSPHGDWKIFERNPDGTKGRYLAELTVTSEDKKVRIDCQVAWRHLPPSDPVASELEAMIKEGIGETRWIMEQREK
ncbi:MAG: hypothetical protein F6K00_00165 [Leptolyngbya sp. SIOISBB]|nr:hypothetical protein [Leptolyngbya sp. SIOISBB]